MEIYKFPSGKNKDDPKYDHQKAKMPEFIYIEDEEYQYQEEGEQKFVKNEQFESFKGLENKRYSIGVRIFNFCGALLAFFICLFILICCVISGLMAALTFFKSPAYNDNFLKYYKWLKTTSVFALGLFVAALSPSLGYGIIILYFTLRGEKMDNGLMSKFIRS